MKSQLKKWLQRLGLFEGLSQMRQLPATVSWLARGCAAPAPQAVKLRIIGSYLAAYRLDSLVETGTYLGDTLGHFAARGVRCLSIELSAELHRQAQQRFSGCGNVTLLLGDSKELLPKVLENLAGPALFWLDGHYSGGVTARGDLLTPIEAELAAIHEHFISDHVILIDDARCFDGSGYPHLDDLLRYVRERGKYRAEVSADIIRLVPNRNPGVIEGPSCC